MNANGGTLIIGVDSKGNILGLESDFAVVRDSKKPNISDEDAFGLRCSGVMEKFLGLNALAYQHLYWHSKEGKKIAAIRVDPSDGPFWLRGSSEKEFYVRYGNKSELLDSEETAKHIKQRWPDWNP